MKKIAEKWKLGFCEELKYYSPLVEIMNHIDNLEGHDTALSSLEELLKLIIERSNYQVFSLVLNRLLVMYVDYIHFLQISKCS